MLCNLRTIEPDDVEEIISMLKDSVFDEEGEFVVSQVISKVSDQLARYENDQVDDEELVDLVEDSSEPSEDGDSASGSPKIKEKVEVAQEEASEFENVNFEILQVTCCIILIDSFIIEIL